MTSKQRCRHEGHRGSGSLVAVSVHQRIVLCPYHRKLHDAQKHRERTQRWRARVCRLADQLNALLMTLRRRGEGQPALKLLHGPRRSLCLRSLRHAAKAAGFCS